MSCFMHLVLLLAINKYHYLLASSLLSYNWYHTCLLYQFRAGKYFSLNDAIKSLLPEFFPGSSFVNEGDASTNQSTGDEGENSCDPDSSTHPLENAEIKLVRIQGIEPSLEIPFSWVVNNLMNPEYFLHICVCLKVSEANAVQ